MRLLALITVLLLWHPGLAAESLATGSVLAPGWKALSYPAPDPGTYELPPLGVAADGAVLDIAGRPHRLGEFLGDKVVVLSFVYMSCPDVNACPLATFVLKGVQRRVLEDAAARDHVRLISLSFDPVLDRPEVMQRHAGHIVPDGADWRFLTTDSQESLAPILTGYGQSVQREKGENGESLGTISHVLRVFLIDRQKRIRNIYSSSFLHADTLWSDVRSILLEAGGGSRTMPPARAEQPSLHGAGDDRSGYEAVAYETRSKNLAERRGAAADLLRFIAEPPLGLPAVPVPPEGLLAPQKVALGRQLFFDRRLSHNDTISCAMCHVPEQGFTSNEIATAVGIGGRTVRRNAPTIYNVAYHELLFHDGRENRLEQQIWGPLLAANEMGNPSVGYVLAKIGDLPDYDGRFEAAFDGRSVTMETLGAALASYQRTLVSAGSPFDRWYLGKEKDALSAPARRGYDLFRDKGKCVGCHRIEETVAVFTDHDLHNTGIGYRQAMGRPADELRVQVAPGTFLRVDPAVIVAASERPPHDLGRYEITGRPEDRWKYRTPSLRNVALTAPYMHDGSLPDLRTVVEFYNAGGVPNEMLDSRIGPLDLDETEVDALVAFLQSLTGDNVDAILADAFAAPVGDPR